ncbi:MAG: hypothetical protein KDD47_02020 [Acidobacteria bacterium]|nr:hypothetical protein [Acidobacteriota bacterium]
MKKALETAEDSLARLHKDPAWVAQNARKEAAREARVAALRREEVPLVEELRRAGCVVDSTWALVSLKPPCSQALPILMAHLQKPYSKDLREIIARALGMPEARTVWEKLIHLYREEQQAGVKDGLAASLAKIAEKRHLGDLMELARDPRQGPSRLLLLSVLDRSRDPRALQALQDLQDDPDLYKEIAFLLKRKERNKRRREAKATG